MRGNECVDEFGILIQIEYIQKCPIGKVSAKPHGKITVTDNYDYAFGLID